tara:strand:+ start:1266 stop:1829 length:564 start_codon:yes stop_codon:yes gene_type:complete
VDNRKKIEEQNNIVLCLKKDNAELTKLNYDLMKKYKVKTSDPVVNDIIDRIFIRHRQGMEKFKKTMAQNSKTIPEWIEETIEENIDAISYMSTLKDRIVAREEKLLKEIDMLKDELTINTLQSDKKDEKIEQLKLEKVKAVEEAKKEADKLMINKCIKYENEIKEVKDDNKKLAKQIDDINGKKEKK